MVNPEKLLITNEYTREALDQMIHVMPSKSDNPLQFLHIVDLHMLASDYSFFKNPRRFALNELLVSSISTQYMRYRSLHALSGIVAEMSLAEAAKFMAEDSSTGNSDLIGWSWLYFHYVEIRLQISQQQFCQMVNLDERTIRRYQNNTIDRFTKLLIQMEQDARTLRRKQLLYLSLPHQGVIPSLIERDEALLRIRTSNIKHCAIFGAPGIGKSVLVEKIIKEKIDNDEIDRIIWISSSQSIDAIKSHLHDRLLAEGATISLKEYVSLKRTSIILDDVEGLFENLAELQTFLKEFSNANIYMTSQVFQPVLNCLQVTLHELSLSAARVMLSNMIIDVSQTPNGSDFADLIWQSVGGNPLAMELLARNWNIFELESATLLTLNEQFSKLYNSIPFSTRLAWLILSLLKDSDLNLSALSEINSEHVKYTDFISLVRLSIAEKASFDSSHISITLSSCKYIQISYGSDSELGKLLDNLIAELKVFNPPSPQLILSLIEAVLSADWVSLSINSYTELLHNFWREGLRRGNYAKWYQILGRYIGELTPENVDLAIGYGISQRCLGRWSQANSILNAVVEYGGMHGLFAAQREALLELAILMRYQGDYVNAIAALDRLDSFPVPRAKHTVQRVLVERIEIALEMNNIADAKRLILDLSDNNVYRFVLQLEIYARDIRSFEELPFLDSIIGDLLEEFRYNSSLTARIHILLGRIYEKETDRKAAINHLAIAMSTFIDTDNDPFALARTQSNLAALLINSNQLEEAQELLNSANHIQRNIGDRVGLAVTMHNEHALIRKIVN